MCEELVGICHTCDELVRMFVGCEEVVPILPIYEELVPIPHTCKEFGTNSSHICDELVSSFY